MPLRLASFLPNQPPILSYANPGIENGLLPGFLAYLAQNCALYYSPVIRAQYAARHRGLTPTVQFNDVAFALHALVLSCITASQYVPSLWGFAPAPGQRPSRFILGIGSGCLLGLSAAAVLVAALAPADPDPATGWCWLDVVYAAGFVKLAITLVKYAPQIATNWRNRSTRGWSIGQILLDFSGGLLSIAQQSIDSYRQRDWSGITGNPVKFALGNVSMLYDLVFFTQHYVLYADGHGPDSPAPAEREALLENGGRRGAADAERRLD